jgi:hypothetical protein
MTIKEAKLRIGDIWNLAGILKWPLDPNVNPDFAFWRNNQHSPALSIFADGQLWKDHGTGDSGDMVAMLAKVEGITSGKACARICDIAEGVAEAPSPIVFAPQATREEKRSRWPVMVSSLTGGRAAAHDFILAEHSLSSGRGDLTEGFFRIASQRHFQWFQGVQAASRRGLLVFLRWFDKGSPSPVDAWGVTDSSREAVQVRRADGKPWSVGKSKSLPGSLGGWPIGIAEVGDRSDIILTEGEGDFLAAINLHCQLNPDPKMNVPRDPGTFGFCCLTGGAKKIADAALPLFKGKTVRIVPHTDETGNAAVNAWGTQLVEAGARVRVFDLTGMLTDDGKPAKDLNDVSTAKGFAAYSQQLSKLFSP